MCSLLQATRSSSSEHDEGETLVGVSDTVTTEFKRVQFTRIAFIVSM